MQPCVNSTRQSRRLLDGFLPLHNAQVRLRCQRVRVVASFLKATREGPEVRERLQRVSIAVYLVAFGLYRPLRRPVRAGGPYSGFQNYVKSGNSMRAVPQKSISPLLNALAGCGRHCAVLLASEHQSIWSPHTAILDESALGRVFR